MEGDRWGECWWQEAPHARITDHQPTPAICQELEDALQLLCTKSEDEAAAAATDKRRLEGVVKSLEARLAQVRLVPPLLLRIARRKEPSGGRSPVAAHVPVPASIITAQAQLELARLREEASGAEQGQMTARAELHAVQEDCARLRWVHGAVPEGHPGCGRQGVWKGV